MPRLRKTLSKEFRNFYYCHDLTWSDADIQTAKDMLARCDPNAVISRGSPEIVLFLYVPYALIKWSIDRGADATVTTAQGTPLFVHAWDSELDICRVLLASGTDVNATNYEGRTALHNAARRGQTAAIQLFLANGADPCKRTDAFWGGHTPLMTMLANCEGMMKPAFADTAELLVDEVRRRRSMPSDEWREAQRQVARIGHQYQLFRADWKEPDEIQAGDAAMARLYALFDVPPAPAVRKHDGGARIVFDDSLPVTKQFAALHEYLVPIADDPLTLQGEVIRIAGAVHHEAADNGGVNWNRRFNQMLKRLLNHFACGNPLPQADLSTAWHLADQIIASKGTACWDETSELCALAVKWVAQNPEPIHSIASSTQNS